MKSSHLFLTLLTLFSISAASAQENIFLDRTYWKANPSIEQIEKDIAAGNHINELNSNMFDAVCYALMEKTDNVTIKHLLKKKGNQVDKLTHDGRTYIFWAAYRDNLEIMQYLVDNGAKANIKDSHGNSVINFAARAGQTNTKLYDFLLAHDADIYDTTNSGAHAILLVAPSVTDYKTFDYFTKKGLDLKSTDNDGNGLFHYTARGGDVLILKKLINKGLPYKTLNKKGGNAILMASEGVDKFQNGLVTFEYLEGLGLKPNITDSDGINPLHAIAYKSDDLSIFNYFIEKGVAVNDQDKGGDSPFMNAANSNELKIVAFLAKYVTDFNLKNDHGRSALAMAVNRNSPEVVEFLLKKGGDINIKDKKGNTLAYYLLNTYNSKKPDIFEAKLSLLRENGLTMTELQNGKNTLYHLAVEENNLNLLKRLEEFQLDINAKNSDGNSALHLAAMKAEDDSILKYLIEKGADKTAKTDFEESVYDLASENELLAKHKVALEFLK
jgi:ankyrin repeat protein